MQLVIKMNSKLIKNLLVNHIFLSIVHHHYNTIIIITITITIITKQ